MAQLLAVDRENIDIFSIQLRQQRPPITDIRFSAHGSPYYKPIKLDGIVLKFREEVCNLIIITIKPLWLQSSFLAILEQFQSSFEAVSEQF